MAGSGAGTDARGEKTYTLDDHEYWTIHPVINRKPSADGLGGLSGVVNDAESS